MAVGDLDANQATPAAMVRDRLEVLLDDPSLDAPTREYFEAVRDRLDDADLDDDNRTGTSLSGVPYDIPHDDEPSPASRRGGSRGSTQ